MLERVPSRDPGSRPFSCRTTTAQAQRCWIWFWTTAGEWSTNNTVNSKTVKLAQIIYSWEELLRCCEGSRRMAGQGNALSSSASVKVPPCGSPWAGRLHWPLACPFLQEARLVTRTLTSLNRGLSTCIRTGYSRQGCHSHISKERGLCIWHE